MLRKWMWMFGAATVGLCVGVTAFVLFPRPSERAAHEFKAALLSSASEIDLSRIALSDSASTGPIPGPRHRSRPVPEVESVIAFKMPRAQAKFGF